MSIVGREAELAIATQALAAARDRTPQMLIVLGAAGIGKTTFGRAICERAREQGFAVGVGRAPELGGAPPLWPWLEAFEALGNDLAEATAALRPSDLDATPSLRFAHFDVVRRALTSAARRQPVLIWLDDVHAGDEPTLVLARALIRQLDDTAVILVLSARDSPADARTPEIAARLGALTAAGHALTLGGLDRPAIATLAGHVDPAVVDALAATTGGHPYFLVELLAAAARGADLGAMLLGPAPPPASVRELVRTSVSKLSVRAQQVLRAAAVIGDRADVSLLASVLQMPEPEVVEAIDDARLGGFAGAEPRRLVFTHALACHALYTELAPTERLRLHARVADALATDDDRVPACAHHAVAAAPLGPARRALALERATRVGIRAMRTFAYEEASRWFAHALANADEPGAIAEASIHLGEARRAAGAASADCFERALELATDPDVYARAALGLASTREFTVRDLSKLALVERAAERATDPATKIRAHARLLRDLVMAPDSQARRADLATRTIALARAHGSPTLLALALDASLVASYGPDSLDARDTVGDEILALARSTADREHELAGLAWKLSSLLERGDVATARALAVEHERVATALGTPGAAINAASRRASIAFLEGQWAEGHAHAERAFELGLRHADSAASLLHAAQCAMPALLRDDRDELARIALVLDEHGGRVIHAVALRALAARIRVALDQRERARAELLALAADDWRAVPADFVYVGALALLATIVVELREVGLAPSLRARLEPYASRNATLGTAQAWGSAALYAGMLAELEDLPAIAAAHYRAALAHNRAMGASPFVAWAARSLGGDAALRAEAAELATRFGLAAAQHASHAAVARLMRAGAVWSIEHDDTTTSVRHQRGLELIATLIAEPDREVHALDLAGGDSALKDERGDALLDPKALRELRTRVLDLDEDIAEAEERGDAARADQAREERQAIAQHLAETLGLGGRSRRATDATERARIAVTVAIRRALQMLTAKCPPIGRHLTRAIRTGTTCAYRPDPAERLRVTL